MRRLSFLACFTLAAVGCGNSILCDDVSSYVAACESAACAACNVKSKCQAGIDINNCAQQLSDSSNFNCAQQRCQPGLVFSPAAAETCLQGYENQDCADNEAGTAPAACSSAPVCVLP